MLNTMYQKQRSNHWSPPVEMAVLWISIAFTLVGFSRVSPFAGILMSPYLSWVSFDGVLNFMIWRLN
ncbi:MAG: tryptophan-rich sensory protein [Desulfomonilaceae bacterium]